MQELQALLSERIWRNPVSDWGLAVVVALTTILVVRLVKALLAYRLRRVAEHTATRIDDIVLHTMGHTRWFFYVMLGVELGARFLRLPRPVRHGIDTAMVLVLLLQIGVWMRAFVQRGVYYWNERHQAKMGKATTMAFAVGFVTQLLVWSLLFILALSSFGIKVSALLAGLGIGGIAAALAVQSVLGDLFASLSIYFDRPFDIGDFIVVDGFMGNVDQVGLRTTRIRSLGGEQLVFPNSHLTGSRIQNFGRLTQRRVVSHLGIVYGTPHEKVARVPALIRQAVDDTPDTRFDRSSFQQFGEYSLVFETVYYVLSSDYNVYMDRQGQLNLRILRAFEAEGIEFAFPTRTLQLQSAGTMASLESRRSGPAHAAPEPAPQRGGGDGGGGRRNSSLT